MIAAKSIEILRARVGLISFTLVVTLVSTLIFSLLSQVQYTANSTIVVNFKETGLSDVILPYNLAESYMDTQIEIIKSPSVAIKVIDRLKLDQDPKWVGDLELDDPSQTRQTLKDVLLENLEVSASSESRMVNVYFSAEDPMDAAALANSFTQAYIDTNLDLSVNPAHRSAEWFNQELDRLRTQLQTAQEKLSAYQLENGILIENRDADIEVVQMNELSRRLLEARTERSAAESRQQEIKKMIDELGSFIALPEVQSNVLVQHIKSELLQKESELSQISSRLGPNHPEYHRLQAEVGTLRSKLSREVNQIGQTLVLEAKKNVHLARSHEQGLINETESEKNRLVSLKKSRDQVPALEQEVLIAQKVYESVLQQYNESNLESRLKMTNIAILSDAIPPLLPSSPKIRINLIVGFALGLLLGIGIAFVAEATNPIIRTEDGLDETLGAPLIGFLEPGAYITSTGRHSN